MLKNSDDTELDKVKKIYKDGWLDCYVMVTCYHYDFYDQYLDFTSENKDRISTYFDTYMIKD